MKRKAIELLSNDDNDVIDFISLSPQEIVYNILEQVKEKGWSIQVLEFRLVCKSWSERLWGWLKNNIRIMLRLSNNTRLEFYERILPTSVHIIADEKTCPFFLIKDVKSIQKLKVSVSIGDVKKSLVEHWIDKFSHVRSLDLSEVSYAYIERNNYGDYSHCLKHYSNALKQFTNLTDLSLSKQTCQINFKLKQLTYLRLNLKSLYYEYDDPYDCPDYSDYPGPCNPHYPDIYTLSLSGFRNLKSLCLEEMPIHYLIESYSSLTNLEQLKLSNTFQSDGFYKQSTDLKELASFPSIKSIKILKDESCIISSIVELCPNLEVFKFYTKCEFYFIYRIPNNFCNLKHLLIDCKFLDTGFKSLDDFFSEVSSTCTRLERLEIFEDKTEIFNNEPVENIIKGYKNQWNEFTKLPSLKYATWKSDIIDLWFQKARVSILDKL